MNECIYCQFCKTLQHSLQYSTYTQAITIELRRILTAILAYILNI